ALGSQATSLIRHFDLPLEEGVFAGEGEERRRLTNRDFFIPGSLLWLDVAIDDPLGYGMLERPAAMFRRSPAFTIRPDALEVAVVAVASWSHSAQLRGSGWAIGAESLPGTVAAARVPLGEGQVVLFGADVVYRGQPIGTFKLLFNAIQGTGAQRVEELRGD